MLCRHALTAVMQSAVCCVNKTVIIQSARQKLMNVKKSKKR